MHFQTGCTKIDLCGLKVIISTLRSLLRVLNGSKEFSWEKTAAQHLEIFKEAMG